MEVITEEEQQEIIEWANQNYTTFQKTGPGRQFQIINVLPDVPACVWKIKKRVMDIENLHNYKQEPYFKDYIGYITDGGKIHKHRDPNEGDLIHTRFNVFVQLPEEGGMPIYNDITIPVKERHYVKCYSGLHYHHCEMVTGPKARIVLSFGFLIFTDTHSVFRHPGCFR